ncbi:MAG: hypothetical protein KY437_06580, partial [Actinobacteria bacterium]|nr:hypothetical protein [Actinomycetota bacterium]
ASADPPLSADHDGLEQGRRRIDRILDEDYLDDIEDSPTDALRRLRDDCREEESVVSYARRVVQGKLDVLYAEVLRRRDEGVATETLNDLAHVLADDEAPSDDLDLRTRAVSTYVPDSSELRRVGERAANIEALGDLEGEDDLTLAKRIGKLAVEEERLSETRVRLLDRIDTLNDEIADRYREGGTDVSEILRRSDR